MLILKRPTLGDGECLYQGVRVLRYNYASRLQIRRLLKENPGNTTFHIVVTVEYRK